MAPATARVRVAASLRCLLPVRHRHGEVTVPVDGSSSLGHVVESVGVPRTEIGELRLNGRPAGASARPHGGDVVDVLPVERPQWLADPRFVLDVHLGTLARRMRLLGIDTAYRNDATDAELVAQGAAEQRVVLTQDRGLLRRRPPRRPARRRAGPLCPAVRSVVAVSGMQRPPAAGDEAGGRAPPRTGYAAHVRGILPL